MIPILYERNETTFASNGITRLSDMIEAKITEERNGIYEMEFSYPVDGVHYADITDGVSFEQIRAAYEDYYKDEFFVRLLPDGANADIHNIKYSNFCDISLHTDERTGTFIAISAIDNMVKGAAGQAIQNMNLIFGLDEKTGLIIVPPAF